MSFRWKDHFCLCDLREHQSCFGDHSVYRKVQRIILLMRFVGFRLFVYVLIALLYGPRLHNRFVVTIKIYSTLFLLLVCSFEKHSNLSSKVYLSSVVAVLDTIQQQSCKCKETHKTWRGEEAKFLYFDF